MHRFKGKFLMLGAVAALIAAFVVLLGSMGGSGTVSATNPTPTPKNANDGPLGGVYDVLVHDGTKAIGLYHAIIKVDHEVAGDQLDGWVVAYADVEVGDAGGEPPSLPGEGADNVPGPNPPPPYGTLPPQRGTGSAAGGNMTLTACFPNQGGTSAPNIIAVLNVTGIAAQLAGGPPKNNTGVAVGTVAVYSNMSDANCAALDVTGAPPAPNLPMNIYKVSEKNKTAAPGCPDSPFTNRPARCVDYDLDGCDDWEELEDVKGCGDDPYNPFDSSAADLDGSYSIATVHATVDPDCPATAPIQCKWSAVAANNPLPGITFHCIASITDPGGATPRTVTERLYCYIDSTLSDLNPEAFPACKGDGFPGASPPGKVRATFFDPPVYTCGGVVLWGDVSQIKHTQLTGTLTAKTLTTTGCFDDDDNQSSLGNVVVNATQEATGGLGTVDIWVLQTDPVCTAANGGTVPGGAPNFDNAILETARQSNNLSRDSDGDGCSDAEELSDDEALGGMRDPFDRWDFYDVDGDLNIGLFGDIFAVAFDFGTAGSDATDRAPAIPGGNVWNLPGPDGLINLFDDIFGVAFQFGHDCSA